MSVFQIMLGLHVHLWLTCDVMFQIMFGLCIYSYSELRYNRTYIYPDWAIGCGWALACSSVIMIPVVAAYRLLTTPGTLAQVRHPPYVFLIEYVDSCFA